VKHETRSLGAAVGDQVAGRARHGKQVWQDECVGYVADVVWVMAFGVVVWSVALVVMVSGE
jgi:hypothetical protein